MKYLLFLCALSLVRAKFVTKNYCCLSCKNKHIMCKYPENSHIGPNCKEYKQVYLDPEKVLNLFNRIKSVKGVYAGATNMMKMDWDYELQVMAQRWANQCPNATDDCRDTARSQVNQIVDTIVNEQFVSPTWESVFLKWYIQEIPLEVIKTYADGPHNALTQLLWSSTRRVGCGASSHLIDAGRIVTLVCNYSPPGNIVGQSVFNVDGGMCTKCPPGSYCSDRQNVNLCVPLGDIRVAGNSILLIIANILIMFSV